jgi:hypothetical protein
MIFGLALLAVATIYYLRSQEEANDDERATPGPAPVRPPELRKTSKGGHPAR